jgi:hypothetical protein
MGFWLAVSGTCALVLLLASNPVLRRRSPDGRWLWRRAVRTQREDLRLGAAILLLAATVFALIGMFAAQDHDPASPTKSAAVVARQSADDYDTLNRAVGAAACLITAAALAMARSCSTRSTQRMASDR